uniref:RING-type domain-containing protein n=1 Tax=Panagrolaimus sp. PS1159 TaxID=55785 RepID=A0AC35GLW2_9BILA
MTSITCPSIGECTICLSPLTPSNTYAITKCGHTFHQRCIRTWLRDASNCPTCRTTAYSYNLIKLFFNAESNDYLPEEVNENDEEVLSDIESDWDDLHDMEDLPLELNAIRETENRAVRYINPQLTILAAECLLRLIIYYLKK